MFKAQNHFRISVCVILPQSEAVWRQLCHSEAHVTQARLHSLETNLIPLALITNSSHKDERECDDVRGGGVGWDRIWHHILDITSKIGKLDSLPVQWFWYYMKEISQFYTRSVFFFDWLFPLKALTFHEATVVASPRFSCFFWRKDVTSRLMLTCVCTQQSIEFILISHNNGR